MDSREAMRTLEVTVGTDQAGLKAAYRRQAKRFHPDRYRTFTEKRWATRKFVRVREAYDVLLRQGTGPEAGPARPEAPVPDLSRVSPWVTPGETEFTIDVDPFIGYHTLARIFLSPLILIDDSKLSRWLGDRGWDGMLLPTVGAISVIAFPGAIGLVAILLPVLLVHTLLLGAGAILDHLLRKEAKGGSTVIVDAVASAGAWLAVEMAVGGGVLLWILIAWFGRPSISGAEVAIGAALWAAPTLFLLVELASFAVTVLTRPRIP